MNQYKLAVCIPTYNSSLIINDTLSVEMERLNNIGIDVYIYDSSTDDQTMEVVNQWKEKYSGIYYKRYPSNMHSNIKVYKIFEDFAESKEYSYIWVRRDYTAYDFRQIENIMDKLKYHYDIIVVRKYGYNQIESKTYIDKNEFFEDNFYALSMYGAAVLNTNTIMKNIDWKNIREKYLNENCINFSHEGFYFEQINRIDSFSGLNLGVKESDAMRSKHKKNSIWINDSIRLWSKCWVETISALPDIYRNKEFVMQRNLDRPFSTDKLLECRKKSAYNLRLFLKYKKWIYKVDGKNKIKYLLVSLIPRFMIDFVAEMIEINSVKKFMKHHDYLVIYGAGLYGKIYASFLTRYSIDFEKFVVSKTDAESKCQMNHTIVSFSEIESRNDNVGIIIALGMYNRMEVFNSLKDMGFEDKIYIPKMIVALKNTEK